MFVPTLAAHYVIYTKCDILHRDLSVNNIMFTRRGDKVVGILNDWDLAASATPKGKATSNHRTGTAAYMALDLLKNADKPLLHEYCHDLESLMWILVWCAFVLRFKGEEVAWKNQDKNIQEWTAPTDWETIARAKREFLKEFEQHLPSTTQGTKNLLNDAWITEVCYEMSSTFYDREKPRAPKGLKVRGNVQEAYNFFTFVNVMATLDSDIEKPEEDVFNYGLSP